VQLAVGGDVPEGTDEDRAVVAQLAVALVDEPRLRLLDGVNSIFQLAQEAVDSINRA